MIKNKRRLFTVTVALLAAVALWGVLLTGTALAQSSQPNTPGQDWHPGMVGCGMMGGHMGYGYGMQSGAAITGTATYGGYGMMGHGMMGGHMGYGYGMQSGAAITGTAPYGDFGMMGHGMMGHGMMGHGMMGHGHH